MFNSRTDAREGPHHPGVANRFRSMTRAHLRTKPRWLRATCVGSVLVLLSGFCSSPLRAQTSARPDTMWADTSEAGLIVGYETLMQRYQTLRPRVSLDTAAMRTATHALLLDGLVVDETRSRLGATFYDLFYRRWEAPEGAAGHTITVQERPAPGLGAVVIVRVDDETVFGTRLQPRHAYIERAAKAAVYYARRHLQKETGSLFDY